MSHLKIGISAILLLAAAGCSDEASTWRPFGTTTTAEDSRVSTAALQAATTDPRVKGFYEARQWRAAWSEGQAAALDMSLRDGERHGIDPQRFISLIKSADNAAEREASLTLAALAYADALSKGVIDPKEVHSIYTVPGNDMDIVAGLNTALETGQVANWLAGLSPTDPEYKALSDAYLRFKTRAAREQEVAIPKGKLLKPGNSDDRVPAIAEALLEAGYYRLPAGQTSQAAPPAPAGSTEVPANSQVPAITRYTPELAAAVKLMQADYGLKADGVIGDDSIALLNTGDADRARQLAINLERRRWLQRTPPTTRIDVNTAATFLTYIHDGNVVWSSKVVVGHPNTPTPSLGSPMHQLVANPPWHVPDSIAENEILPKGPEYLQQNNMHVKDGQIIQAPGPDSALGLVKFDLKNDHAIYLHDTPSKKLFAQNERHLSHGCIRVENPLDLARLIADQNNKRAEFDAGLESGETKFIALTDEIPVRLLYHTAYLDQDGQISFRPDVYGSDQKLAAALGIEPSTRRSVLASIAAPLGP